jgi:hypothetical protein
MRGLSGPACAAEAEQLASFYGVDISRIYTVSRKERPDRKRRSDLGKRKQQLLTDEILKIGAEMVVNQKLSANLAYFIMSAQNDKFGEIKISLGTFQRYLREEGISRTQASKNRKPYRRFEADFAGQIFQLDMSGVKERWVDTKTRAILKVDLLEVSKNHPNRRKDRVPLWKFALVDDKSRKKFVRFIACQKPNTVHVVNFLKEAFAEMGLPIFLYTDKDSVIHNKRMRRGAKILDEAFKDSGGFDLFHHMPGNPQATGKVERTHRIIEEYERAIGVYTAYGRVPNVDDLNRYLAFMCDRYNQTPCRATGMAPDIAFRDKNFTKRIVAPELLDAAFKARDLSCLVQPDVTIEVDNISYQLSRKASDPFNLLAEMGRQRLDVFWLDDEDFFACVTPDGEEYICQKVLAKADSAFEYKAMPETRSQKNRKTLERSQKERAKAIKATATVEEPGIIIPGFDTDIPERAANIADFPQRIETGDVQAIHDATHHVANPDPFAGHQLDSFDALDMLQRHGKAPLEPCQELMDIKSWLRQFFNGSEFLPERELMDAFESRMTAPPVKLAAVK